MARLEKMDLGIKDRLQHGDVFFARYAKHVFDSLVFETTDQELGSCHASPAFTQSRGGAVAGFIYVTPYDYSLNPRASYLEEGKYQRLMYDLVTLVRKHPVRSLLVIGSLGVFLARRTKG
jgi:hypothetical protein